MRKLFNIVQEDSVEWLLGGYVSCIEFAVLVQFASLKKKILFPLSVTFASPNPQNTLLRLFVFLSPFVSFVYTLLLVRLKRDLVSSVIECFSFQTGQYKTAFQFWAQMPWTQHIPHSHVV